MKLEVDPSLAMFTKNAGFFGQTHVAESMESLISGWSISHYTPIMIYYVHVEFPWHVGTPKSPSIDGIFPL